MGSLFLLILYLVVFIVQIILLVKSIKRKEIKNWIKVFTLEVFSIIISISLLFYYESLPGYGFMPGLSYLGEILLSFGVAILYSIMLFITICAKIIIYEKHQKQQGKKYANPFVSIIAIIFIIIGIVFLSSEIINNWGKKETTGTVVDYIEIRTGGGIEYWPIIRFYVDGKEYEDDYPIYNAKIGDDVKIYYHPVNEEYHITSYYPDNKFIYIPTLIIGILIIILRFKDNIFKLNTNENKIKHI